MTKVYLGVGGPSRAENLLSKVYHGLRCGVLDEYGVVENLMTEVCLG